MKTWAIRDWDKHFEKAQSRKVESVQWIPLPVKHDGLGFRRLMEREDGVSIYGSWVLIVQVAAKCPTRGVLLDERGPLNSKDLALKTGAPVKQFDAALKVLSSPEIGWIVMLVDDSQPDGRPLPLQGGQVGQDKQDKTNKEVCSETASGSEPTASTARVSKGTPVEGLLVFPTVGEGKAWALTPQKLEEYRQAFPGLDPLRECKKALQWCVDNPAKRKTPRGMPSFLFRWLSRSQNGSREDHVSARRGVDIDSLNLGDD